MDRFPRPVRWAGLALAVLTVAALVVIVVHGKSTAAAGTEPAPAPVPPAGALTTELPPAGLVTQAGWVLPIAPGTVPVTDPASGVTAVITAQDRSTAQTAAQRVDPRDRWLSVLEPDGRTRYAVPLDDPPRFGPVITTVDGTLVVLVGTADQVRYWPLTGGPGTDVDLPTGAHPTATTVGGSVLFTLPGDRVGYLHDGAVHVVPLLPRTDPGIAVDGAVVLTQPDTGAWWTVRGDAAPTPYPARAAARRRRRARRPRGHRHPGDPGLGTGRGGPEDPDRDRRRLRPGHRGPAGHHHDPGRRGTHTGTAVGNDQVGLTAAGPVVLTTPTTGPATRRRGARVHRHRGRRPGVRHRHRRQARRRRPGRHRDRAAGRHPHPHRDRRAVPAGGQPGPALRTAPRGRHMTRHRHRLHRNTHSPPADHTTSAIPIREEPTP